MVRIKKSKSELSFNDDIIGLSPISSVASYTSSPILNIKIDKKKLDNLTSEYFQYHNAKINFIKSYEKVVEESNPVSVKKSIVTKEELVYDNKKMVYDKPYEFTMYGKEYALVKSKEKKGEIILYKKKKTESKSSSSQKKMTRKELYSNFIKERLGTETTDTLIQNIYRDYSLAKTNYENISYDLSSSLWYKEAVQKMIEGRIKHG